MISYIEPFIRSRQSHFENGLRIIIFSKTYENSTIPSDRGRKTRKTAPLSPVPQSKKANIIIGAITDSLHFHETKRMAAALHVRSPRSPARRRKFIRASVRGEVRACTSEVSSVGNVSRRTTMRGRKHTITALGSVRARQLHRMLAVFLRRSTIAPISKGASTLIIGVATSPTNRAAKNWQGFTIGFAIGRQAIGIYSSLSPINPSLASSFARAMYAALPTLRGTTAFVSQRN